MKSVLRYIDNNIQKGVKIDWNLIFYRYRKLKCPGDTYDPTNLPINDLNWFVILSARSRGKTTNLLLIGLLLYDEYGIQTGYIRQYDNMITATKTKNLFNVINEFHYIEKIFGETWNSTYLWQKYIYLCKRDENGEIIEKSPKPFCVLLSTDKSADYKSSMSLPMCDWLVFDEFMSDRYTTNEFIDLCQLISTIRRDRLSTKIICSSNMVNMYNRYLEEMGLRETVQTLKPGEYKIIKTPLGLSIYVTILNPDIVSNKKKIHANMTYFGFANKELSAITGEEWQIKNYPHLPRPTEEEHRELITRDCYVNAFGHNICMEFYRSDVLGLYVHFRPYEMKELPDDGIVFTDRYPTKPNEVYGVGTGTKMVNLWDLYRAHRDYYSSNEIGNMIETYINSLDRSR